MEVCKAPHHTRGHAASSDDQGMGMQLSILNLIHTTVRIIHLSLWKFLLQPLERLFVTEKNVSADLEDLECEASMPVADVEKAEVDLHVTDMNDNQLKINIKGKGNGEITPRKKKMSESSDDIEIVHTHEPPKLHGILKQRSRTTSESSDEGYSVTYSRENSVSMCGSEDTISEEDEEDGETGCKKSVSFSEHIDKTMYKTNMPISALSSTLKNKRKKQRKRDAKHEDKQKRRRRRTSGSMSSDAEESSSVGDDASTDTKREQPAQQQDVGDENVFEKPEGENSDVSSSHDERSSSHSQDEGTVPKASKNKSRKNRRKNKKNKNSQQDAMATDAHQPPETSKQEEASVSTADSVNGVSESLDGMSEKANGVNEDVNDLKDEGDSAVPEPDTGLNGGGSTKKAAVKLVQDAEDSDDNECDAGAGDAKLDKDTNRTNFADQLPKPESMLSWEDGKADPQHKTQCAFEFANSLMYDLDED